MLGKPNLSKASVGMSARCKISSINKQRQDRLSQQPRIPGMSKRLRRLGVRNGIISQITRPLMSVLSQFPRVAEASPSALQRATPGCDVAFSFLS